MARRAERVRGAATVRRAGTLPAIAEFVARQGCDPSATLGAAGMKVAAAADPYRWVEVRVFMAQLECAVAHTGRRDTGLELGLSLDPAHLGPLGLWMQTAPTIAEALTGFVRYAPVFQTRAHFAFVRGAYRVTVEYASGLPHSPGRDLDSEVVIGGIMALVNRATGRRVVPHAVQFDHEPVCTAREYLRWLAVRPVFGGLRNSVSYALELLDEPVCGGDAGLHAMARRHLEDLLQRLGATGQAVVDAVMDNVRLGFATGRATLDLLAAELGVEPRTLQRRLLAAGTTFQKICDGVRLDLARTYLEHTAMDLGEIAAELGYAEPGAFQHAFKRWTGRAPGSYRKNRVRPA